MKSIYIYAILIDLASPAQSFGWVGISAGAGYTCGLTDGGAIECIGDDSPEAWDGRANGGARWTPTTCGAAFTALDLGRFHTCALTSGGAIQCIGYDYYGQANGKEPWFPTGGATFKAVSAGEHHTCGLTEAGSIECIGKRFGVNAPLVRRGFPASGGAPFIPTTGGDAFTALAAGSGGQTCGLTSGGAIECIGFTAVGEESWSPATGGYFTALDAGRFHTCALTDGGSIECIGDDYYGQTNGGLPWTPTDGAFKAVSAGFSHTCGLTDGGWIECIGDGTTWGIEQTNGGLPWAPTMGGAAFTALAAGDFHTCGVTNVGIECIGGSERLRHNGEPWTPTTTTEAPTPACTPAPTPAPTPPTPQPTVAPTPVPTHTPEFCAPFGRKKCKSKEAARWLGCKWAARSSTCAVKKNFEQPTPLDCGGNGACPAGQVRVNHQYDYPGQETCDCVSPSALCFYDMGPPAILENGAHCILSPNCGHPCCKLSKRACSQSRGWRARRAWAKENGMNVNKACKYTVDKSMQNETPDGKHGLCMPRSN